MEKNKKKQNKKGSALAFTLIIMSIVMIILVSMLSYISSQLKFGLKRVEREEAFQIAEAGIYYYRWYLAHQTAGKTPQQVNTFWETGGGSVGFSYEADYEGVGKYIIKVTPPISGSTIATVTSAGHTYKEPDIKRTVKARFRRPSWSEYAVLANDFMRFGDGTEVYGKIHSNAGIRFDGVANNIVSSLLGSVDDPDHDGNKEFGVHTHVNPPPGSGINDNFRSSEAPPTSPVPSRTDVFKAGRQFPVSEVSFNGVISNLALMKSQAEIGGTKGIYFGSANPMRIIFKTDGTFDAYKIYSYNEASYAITSYVGTKNSNGTGDICETGATNGPNAGCQNETYGNGRRAWTCYCNAKNYLIPDDGVIFVENNAWVEGVIDGKKVTVVAANISGNGLPTNIYVGNNNLRYTNYDGNDVIGLVAQKNLLVIRDSQNILTIDGALLAQSGRVGRDWYNSAYNKSTITINGSLATNQRYGFAYTDGTGYHTRILNFDNNLLYYPPPYFPTGTDYAIDLWEEI